MLPKAILGTVALAVVGCGVAKLFEECDEEKCNAIQNDIEEKMQEIELEVKRVEDAMTEFCTELDKEINKISEEK